MILLASLVASLLSASSIINYVIIIAIAIGGIFVVRHSRKNALIAFQKETIEAFQQRMDLLEAEVAEQKGEISALREENALRKFQLETVTLALKQRGIVVTFDGDLITISDQHGTQTTRRRKTARGSQGPQVGGSLA
jgi:hypothetical protein